MEHFTHFISAHPTIWEAVKLSVVTVMTVIVLVLVLRLERKLTKKWLANHKSINLRFVESVVRFILIVVAVQWVMMSSPLTRNFGKVLFQGTAIIGAIVALAAQPVMADMICGLMLSSTRPFEIGDRIELDNGIAGVVRDITMRHVVIRRIDTIEVIVPNSKLNSMTIVNTSYQSRRRSVHLSFHVAYNAPVERAMEIIRDAVMQSPYTVPGKPGPNGDEYGPVYFMEYAESSLVMATTVYYETTSPTEVVRSDVNLRVKRALEDAGIEIPYNYVNVVMREPKAGD